ncbi:MAG: XRE family transcriptional regulator [Rhizobiales bacterium PAR1]|nr:MAG: XRE family transcriptional regulator [Rhizobiales bacterium PAR1]
MEKTSEVTFDQQIAARLGALRAERGWSLDDLALRSGISRSTLSRLENADVSPTAQVLGKLCAAYGMPMSRLMRLVEDSSTPVVRAEAQLLWVDPGTGFRRRSVSPPTQSLAGEVLACEIPAGTRIAYELPPKPGLEHHLVMLRGALTVTVDGQAHSLKTGDCLRYALFGASCFETPPEAGATYFLFLL